MKSRSELFSLWTATGKDKMIHISDIKRDPCQYYRSRVLSYSFKESDQ